MTLIMSEKETIGGSREPLTNKQLAQIAGVSVSSIKRAKRAAKLAPEKVDAMIAGEITPTQVIKEAEKKQTQALIERQKDGSPNGVSKWDAMSEKDFQASVVRLAKQLGWLVYHTYDS